MKKQRHKTQHKSVQLQMTAMIDVVFLLLAFFVMTFKIIEPEGDFGIKMPKLPAENTMSVQVEERIEPLRIRLISDSDGNLNRIILNDTQLGPQPDLLREKVIAILQPDILADTASEVEAILDCDPQLRYAYTIEALTAISGYYTEGRLIPLIEKVTFAKR